MGPLRSRRNSPPAIPRIAYLPSDSNRGAAWNFNRVAKSATGDFFKWWAADDRCSPWFIERAAAALEADPGAILAHPEAAFEDREGRVALNTNSRVSRGRGAIEGEPSRVLRTLDRGAAAGPLPDLGWHEALDRRALQVLQAVARDGRAAMILVYGLMRIAALQRTRLFGNYYGADLTLAFELSLNGGFVRLTDEMVTFARDTSGCSANWFDSAYQQRFWDPALQGTLRVGLQYRRRHTEFAAAIVRSRLARRTKIFRSDGSSPPAARGRLAMT